jgi:hypothetical protein
VLFSLYLLAKYEFVRLILGVKFALWRTKMITGILGVTGTIILCLFFVLVQKCEDNSVKSKPKAKKSISKSVK